MAPKKKERRKGHCNWTNAEVESLKFQADVLHLEWPSIAKVSFFGVSVRLWAFSPDDNGPYRR